MLSMMQKAKRLPIWYVWSLDFAHGYFLLLTIQRFLHRKSKASISPDKYCRRSAPTPFTTLYAYFKQRNLRP